MRARAVYQLWLGAQGLLTLVFYVCGPKTLWFLCVWDVAPVILCVRAVDPEWFMRARAVDPGVECGKGGRPCVFHVCGL